MGNNTTKSGRLVFDLPRHVKDGEPIRAAKNVILPNNYEMFNYFGSHFLLFTSPVTVSVGPQNKTSMTLF